MFVYCCKTTTASVRYLTTTLHHRPLCRCLYYRRFSGKLSWIVPWCKHIIHHSNSVASIALLNVFNHFLYLCGIVHFLYVAGLSNIAYNSRHFFIYFKFTLKRVFWCLFFSTVPNNPGSYSWTLVLICARSNYSFITIDWSFYSLCTGI